MATQLKIVSNNVEHVKQAGSKFEKMEERVSEIDEKVDKLGSDMAELKGLMTRMLADA